MKAAPTAWLFATLIVGSGVAAAEPPSISAFASLPDVDQVSISPDGNTLAWIGYDRGVPAVTVYELKKRQYLRSLHVESRYRLRNLAWVDDSTLLVTVSFTVTLDAKSYMPSWEEFYRILVFDVWTQKTSVLLLDDAREALVSGVELLRLHTGRPGVITVSGPRVQLLPRCSPVCWEEAIYDVDLRTNEERVVATGPYTVKRWIVDRTGQPIARVEWARRMLRMELSVLRDDSWQRLYRDEDYFNLNPVSLTADNTALIAIGPHKGQRSIAWRLPLDGAPFEPLWESDEDIESIIEDSYTGAPVGYRLGGLEQRVHWVDSEYQRVQAALERTFPGQRIYIESRSANFQRVVVSAGRGASPMSYYVVDRDNGTAEMIGESYPALAGVELGKRQAIQFKARDGMPIPGYLTLPPIADSKKVPLVVLLHDGPGGRDAVTFDWRAQFLATRGYAVFQPQYRGSTGFGTQLERAGKEQWGRAVLDDVEDGVRHLVDQQITNNDSICFVGEGYGGYIALAIAARSTRKVACVATINGVTDLPGMYRYFVGNFFDDTMTIAEFRERIGNPFALDLDRESPRKLASQIRAPVILFHARDDSIVPRIQAEKFIQASRKREAETIYVELPDADHSLSAREARESVLQSLESFLARHLRPAKGEGG